VVRKKQVPDSIDKHEILDNHRKIWMLANINDQAGPVNLGSTWRNPDQITDFHLINLKSEGFAQICRPPS
tara:strand:+ start:209 stop:418 length:210 start_codon:yes stop_codon:yes gene_type:complete